MATPEQLARLQAAVPFAQEAQRKYGVPASVSLAQWITESTWGTSGLATKANNFFGIKRSHQANPESYVEFPTPEFEGGKRVIVEALFVRYPDEAASFEAHASLLASSARYHRAMLSARYPKVFAVELQHSGYSTNPKYAEDLMTLMRDFNLTQYDVPDPPAVAQEAA